MTLTISLVVSLLLCRRRRNRHSPAVRDDLWSRDDHHPADDIGNGQVSRDAQQRARVYEAERGSESAVGARDGLRRLHLGHDQRPGHLHGTLPFSSSSSAAAIALRCIIVSCSVQMPIAVLYIHAACYFRRRKSIVWLRLYGRQYWA